MIRQSKGRDDSLSPAEQLERISDYAEREGMTLLGTREEIDISGGAALERRPGLQWAVGEVEAKRADVVVVAYFDRLVRSLRVQDEVVSRVEAAGGRVMSLDFGRVTGETAAQWLSGTMMGAVSEYYRRSVRERAGAAQRRAVEEGRIPFAAAPPGYARPKRGGLVIDPKTAPIAREAFAMRRDGATIAAVRAHLASHGIVRSYHGVQHMLSSRLYLGEINFGELVNREAHEPLIDRATFDAVQRIRAPRGRRAKSERLLARLGVLRCGSCGARMVVGMQRQNGRSYPFYRCPPVGDCTQRVTIGAAIVEEMATEHAQATLANVEGRASALQEARVAAEAAAEAQGRLDAAIRVFDALGDEPAAVERLEALRVDRDERQARADHLASLHSTVVVTAGADWDDLTLEARRGLIKATIAAIYIRKGGVGRERITIETLGQDAARL